jgi:hypothetical protein
LALATSLISYWPLNEASGTRSDLHGTNHLADTNSTGQGAGLVYANAATFTEGDYKSLSLADNASLSTGDISFTFAAWVKFTSIPGYNYSLGGKHNFNADIDEYLLYLSSSGTMVFQIRDTSGGHNQVEFASTVLDADTWYLVIGYHDATNNVIGIQVNGGTAETTAHTTGVRDGTASFVIGGQTGLMDLSGSIGPAAFWKQALSETDRNAFYNSGAGRTYASLVTSYTVQAALGTFTLTGQAANLVPRTALYANHGTFTLTGQSANLGHNRIMVAARGSFTLAGQDVLFSRTTAVQAPTTSVTRSASTAQRTINISAEARRMWGAEWTQPEPLYEFSGRTFKARTLDSGIYRAQPTVPDPEDVTHYLMTASTGLFALTGYEVSDHLRMVASHGSFTLSGQAAGLKRGKKMPAVTGTFTLTGQAVQFFYFADVGDFATTGNIVVNQRIISGVADTSIFSVGDKVIVEVPDDIGRGEVGPGGTWPSLSRRYASTGAIQTAINNGTIPNGGFAWVSGTGLTYVNLGGSPAQLSTFFEGYYYHGMAVPRALHGTVESKTTDSLTLVSGSGPTNGFAQITRTGCNVYKDMALALSTQVTAGQTLQLEGKDYPIGSPLRIDDKDSCTIAGAGKTLTRIFSPRGCASATMDIWSSTGVTVRDLTWEGNVNDDGYGFNYGDLYTSPHRFSGVDDNNFPQATQYSPGIVFVNGSHNGTVSDVHVKNVYQLVIGTYVSNELNITNASYEQDSTDWDYTGWKFQYSNTIGGTMTNISIICHSGTIQGFEFFLSRDVHIEGLTTHNANGATNSAGEWTINNWTATFDANCITEGQYINANEPVININSNIDHGHFYNSLGGTLSNVTMVQPDYIDALNNTFVGVIVNDNNANILLRDINYTAPNFIATPGQTTLGARAVRSTSRISPAITGTSIQRITCSGTARNDDPNVCVYVLRGNQNLGGHSVTAGQQVIFYGA